MKIMWQDMVELNDSVRRSASGVVESCSCRTCRAQLFSNESISGLKGIHWLAGRARAASCRAVRDSSVVGRDR